MTFEKNTMDKVFEKLNEIIGPMSSLPKTTTFNLDEKTSGFIHSHSEKLEDWDCPCDQFIVIDILDGEKYMLGHMDKEYYYFPREMTPLNEQEYIRYVYLVENFSFPPFYELKPPLRQWEVSSKNRLMAQKNDSVLQDNDRH